MTTTAFLPELILSSLHTEKETAFPPIVADKEMANKTKAVFRLHLIQSKSDAIVDSNLQFLSHSADCMLRFT